MSDDEIKMLKNMGALGYPADKIVSVMGVHEGGKVMVLGLPEDKFLKEFSNEKSEIKIIYSGGADLAQYRIDLKLFEMSCSGDLKAMDKLERRKRNLASVSTTKKLVRDR